MAKYKERTFHMRKRIKEILPLPLIKLLQLLYDDLFEVFCFITAGVKTHKYAGFFLKIYIFDPVSKRWYDHDWKRNEIDFLLKGKLKEGSRVFDIGAHHGVVALILSKIVGEKGKVIAVEMDKKHSKIAEINKENNDATNLKIVNCAIGNKVGIISFTKDQVDQKFEKSKRSNVKVKTLDMLSNRYGFPSVIYIDVEGYECHVLEGAKNTLKTSPDLLIEVHVKNGLENFEGSIEKILSYINKDKYKLFMAEPSHNCTFRPFNVKSKLIKDRFYLAALSKI